MSDCTNCRESIISQTPSLIGETQCNEACPEDITCSDILPSNCIFYSGATLSCPSGNTSVVYGDSITVALNKMYALICQNSTSNTVQITANDTCYGYLASKITSTSLDITTTNPGACEKLNIEEKCWTWNTVTNGTGDGKFKRDWFSAATYQQVQYSNLKECTIRLRGTAKNSNYTGLSQTIFVLPSGKRPAFTRRFSVGISHGANLLPSSFGFIYIYSTGDVVLQYQKLTAGTTIVSLDGIYFETN